MLKYFKTARSGLAALLIILCSTLLRLALLVQGWPFTNSDEATMGLMARDIAYRGQHPIFFYGQHYMGALEAYIAAIAFHLLGSSSLLTLRLGLVLLFACFLLSTYLLTSVLYSKAWALLVVSMLGLGSSFVLARELSAIGGYPETLLLGSLTFLLATKLALTHQPGLAPGRLLLRPTSPGSSRPMICARLLRSAGYACWGMVIGLGLWSDLLIAPFALCSTLLLLLCCRDDLRRLFTGPCALLGLVVGASPLLAYNLSAAPGQDSLSVLWQIQHSSSGYLLTHFGQQIAGTLQVSIPMMTGEPFCPVPERLEPGVMSSLACILTRGSWGMGYMLLFILALIMSVRAILQSMQAYRQLRQSHVDGTLEDLQARQSFVVDSARLLLLACALITLLLYATGGSPVDWPGSRARYLIGLLIATPAILWPLWYGVTHAGSQQMSDAARRHHFLLRQDLFKHYWPQGLRASILLVVTSLLLLGTIQTFAELPATQRANQQQQALIEHLVQIRATHIYSDYWTCDRLAFVSNEHILCGVVEQDLQRSTNFNRDAAYYPIVNADPYAVYVFSIHTPISRTVLQTRLAPNRYTRSTFAQYVIYQPENIQLLSMPPVAQCSSSPR